MERPKIQEAGRPAAVDRRRDLLELGGGATPPAQHLRHCRHHRCCSRLISLSILALIFPSISSLSVEMRWWERVLAS